MANGPMLPARGPPRASRIGIPRRNLLGSACCALFILGLQFLVVSPFIWAGGAVARKTQPTGDAAGTDLPDDPDRMEVLILDDGPSTPARTRETYGEPALAQPTVTLRDPTNMVPQVIGTDPDALKTHPIAKRGTADLALAGLYLGQINARIDRAWLRPRTQIGAPYFSCRVRIDQDDHGNVTEITLEKCNGDTRWQMSLVNAIQSASPLPSPPDPSVYRSSLKMAFRSEAYSPATNSEGFEPETIPVSNNAPEP